MEQVTQWHGMHPPVHVPSAPRDQPCRNRRQPKESLQDDPPSSATAVAAAEQQQHGRTAMHADMATVGECYSYLPTAADDNGHAAPAADANPITSATVTVDGKLWWRVPSGQPDGNVWYGSCIPSYQRECHGAPLLTSRGRQ